MDERFWPSASTSGQPAAHSPAKTPPDLVGLKSQWADFQHRRTLKTTSQRELIVDVFLRSTDHLSIEELLAKVRERNARVGYATVYRTLKLLSEAGLSAPRQFGDGQTRYEVTGAESPHHDHLICVRCGLILEFENDQIEQLQDKMAERLGGFKIVRHKLELYGLCQKALGVPGGICPNDQNAQTGQASVGTKPGPGEVG